MLVVDTPFPPYKPVEYVRPVFTAHAVDDDVYGWSDEPEGTNFTLLSGSTEDGDTPYSITTASKWVAPSGQMTRSDGRPAFKRISAFKDSQTTVTTIKWQINGWHHRDGDLPAILSLHNIQPAIAMFFKKGLKHRFNGPAYMQPRTPEQDQFYLYGISFSEADFLKVHACAIQYKVPLWVATVYTVTGLDFKLNKNLDASIWALPFEWQWKLFEFKEDELWMVILSGDSRGQTDKVTQIAALVKHEQKQFLRNQSAPAKALSVLEA